jgi:hypothetical protein
MVALREENAHTSLGLVKLCAWASKKRKANFTPLFVDLAAYHQTKLG